MVNGKIVACVTLYFEIPYRDTGTPDWLHSLEYSREAIKHAGILDNVGGFKVIDYEFGDDDCIEFFEEGD